jgi:hypothetical protein
MPLKSTAEVFRYGKIDIDNTQDDRLDAIESDLQTKATTAQVATKVDKTGDTMTGNLILGGSSKLGIGLSSPAEAIDVNGNARISGTLTSSGTTILASQSSSIDDGLRIVRVGILGTTQMVIQGANNGSTCPIRFSQRQGTNPHLFISSGGNVGINTDTPAERLDVSGNIEATGTITGDVKNFKINHPDPSKTDTHHLYHTSIESNTAGTCHYEYKVYVENTKVIELPSYFKHLIDYNSVKCHITPIGNMVMFCYNIIDDSHIEIKTSSPTNVAVLVTGVRKDCGAIKNWKGAERLKPEPELEPLQEESQEIYTGITEETEEDEYKEEEIQQQEQEENHSA